MHTRADEYRDAAVDAIQAADEAMAEFVLEVFARRCDGHDEYVDGYEQRVRLALQKLHEIREMVSPR